MRCCALPLSPIAHRAALMRVVVAEFGDDPPRPDRGDQIVPADQSPAVLDQVLQKVEGLRLDPHNLTASAQFPTVRVKRIVVEQIAHSLFRLSRRPRD